jgi:hypothetical protein
MAGMGKLLVFAGVFIAFIGLLLVFFGRANLPIGRLPGDLVYRGKNTTVYFPVVTSILLSVVLTLVLWLVGRFGR